MGWGWDNRCILKGCRRTEELKPEAMVLEVAMVLLVVVVVVGVEEVVVTVVAVEEGAVPVRTQ
jgi:hypothetical protein